MAMSNNISVYGYDNTMLSRVSALIAKTEVAEQKPLDPEFQQGSTRCWLLELPVELRLKILEFVLPYTADTGTRGIAWIRGHCAILGTSRLLFSEGIRIVYGRNTFVIDVVWDGITFAYQWLLPTGLVPKRTFAFPGKLASRNVSQIRQMLIRIHHVDNYTGMVKHNFSGPGLREGLRIQVEQLCQTTLQDTYEINHLHIHFQNDSHTMSIDQQILRPLLKLTKTRNVAFSGSVTAECQRTLKQQLADAYDRNSIFRLPLEVRDLIYDLVLPRTEIIVNTHPTQHKYVRWRKGYTDILVTCTTIYKEASGVLYGTRNFQLTCGGDRFIFTPFWLPDGRLLPGLRFPESVGIQNFRQIKHFTIYVPLWWAHIDEKGRHEREAMLESMGKLLQCNPRITSLTLICFCWKLDKEWYEKAMQEILRLSGIARVDIYGLDREMAKRFRMRLRR